MTLSQVACFVSGGWQCCLRLLMLTENSSQAQRKLMGGEPSDQWER